MVFITDESTSLQQFKEVVGDLNQDDNVLIRFLRARDHDLSSAEKMLRNAVQWRKDTGIESNSYLNWKFPSHFHSDMKYRYFGREYEGAPICWLFLGSWPVKRLLENEETEQIKRYTYTVMEQGLNQTVVCKSPGNIVMDFEGFSYVQATDITTMKLAYYSFQAYEQCYPETIKAMYIINVPWVCNIALNFVKGVFAQKTLEKTKIFNCKEEWHAEFLKIFPRERIVPELQPPI